MFGYFIEDFQHSLADVVQFVGVCILVLGFSNLFWYGGSYPRSYFLSCFIDTSQGSRQLHVRKKARDHCIEPCLSG